MTSVVFSSCDVLQDVADIALSDTAQTTTPSLTEGEVASGLKEALTLGITNAVNTTSITDGFLNNVNIRLPFPEDAIKVREKAISWGMENKINQFEGVSSIIIMGHQNGGFIEVLLCDLVGIITFYFKKTTFVIIEYFTKYRGGIKLR